MDVAASLGAKHSDRTAGRVLAGYDFACQVQKNETPKTPGQYAWNDPRFELWVSPKGAFDLWERKRESVGLFDAVFIDGDHSQKAVEHDTEMARKIVRPGGIIIWHDYHDMDCVDVRKVLDAQYPRNRD